MAVNDTLFDKGGAVYNVMASGYGVTGGTGGTDDRAALNTLLNSTISPGGTAWFPPGTYRIDSSLSVPAGVALAFAAGARIRPASGAVLTLNGPLQAPLSQVFDLSQGGQVTFGRGVAPQVYPQWFGAKGDAVRRDAGVGMGVSISSGSATVTFTGGSTFTSADVGKLVTVGGAGAGGADLYTTISGVTSASVATLATTASTTKTDTSFTMGTDDYPAIVAAVATAIRGVETGEHRRVVFPAGGYLINNVSGRAPVLSAFSETYKYGILFQGEGIASSELILRTAGQPQWFYVDDGSGKLALPTFADLRFSADSPAWGKGFKLDGASGHPQFFQFRTCMMSGLSQGFEFTGTLMDSEMRFYGCKFINIDQFYRIANNQAVDHEFYGCDIEGSTSDIFYVTGNGGGGVRMYGGSVIWSQNQQHDAWLLHVDSTSVGYGNSDFTFSGIRTEMHTAYAKLVKYAVDQGELVVNFESCNLTGTVAGGAREAVYIGLNKSVRFAGCSIPAEWSYRIASDDSFAPGYPTHGIVGFEGCVIPPDLSSKITLAHTFGRAYARDCHVRQAELSAREATSFDVNGFNDMLGDVGSIIKVAVLRPAAFASPAGASAASYEQTLKLPVGATLRSIQMLRPGGTGNSTPYQLHVGKDDKSVIYASSTLATDNDPAVIHADVFRTLGTSDRTIRLWANPAGATLVAGGYAIVEYY